MAYPVKHRKNLLTIDLFTGKKAPVRAKTNRGLLLQEDALCSGLLNLKRSAMKSSGKAS